MKRKNIRRSMAVAVILTVAMVLQSGIIAFAGELEEIPSEEVIESMVFGDALTEFTEDPSGIIFNGNSDSVKGSEDDAQASADSMTSARGNASNNGSTNGVSVGTVKNLKVKRGGTWSNGQKTYRKYNISFSKVSGASGYLVMTFMPREGIYDAWVEYSNKGIWIGYDNLCSGNTAYVRVYAFKKSGKKYIQGAGITKSYTFKY